MAKYVPYMYNKIPITRFCYIKIIFVSFLLFLGLKISYIIARTPLIMEVRCYTSAVLLNRWVKFSRKNQLSNKIIPIIFWLSSLRLELLPPLPLQRYDHPNCSTFILLKFYFRLPSRTSPKDSRTQTRARMAVLRSNRK